MDPEFIPAAEFLTKLPRSNLDDREFEDLVNECLLRIPRYCPEWTNYNPGDPGVTLIELFSWLVHQMMFRFNQVPRRHYVAFLELLGIRLLAPRPASTELTFYLTKEQSDIKRIPAGTEVATERTENQEAILFTTSRDLVIGQPAIKHLLLSEAATDYPDFDSVSTLALSFDTPDRWSDLETSLELFRPCQPDNCFYLVLEPAAVEAASEGEASAEETLRNTIEGNVLALRFTGPRAVTTGIAPDNPPLDWQVWTGERWQSGILRQRSDDHTKGFSFDRLGFAGPNPEQEGADVVLHLPQNWPVHRFGNYQGHWIRCVYTAPDPNTRQTGYDRSPEITGLSLRALGGTITASECVHMPEEFLGTSDGKAGQEFQLEGTPVLDRDPEERIFVMLPDGEVQDDWREVEHFGDSREGDPHYTIDSTSGRVQFGPLIREPSQLVTQTRDRSQLQSWGRPFRQRRSLTLTETQTSLPAVMDTDSRELERQYGRVLPLGAKVYIRRYRVGGGSRGNVQAEQLKVLKTAIPYVKRVINYHSATGGTDAESLDQAVMRVPSLLRTRKTTLTPEEFEQAARQFTGNYDDIRLIYRAHSVTAAHLATPGVVHLLVIPYPENWAHLSLEGGIHPQTLLLTSELATSLQQHLDTHRALGIRVKPDSPEYVGIQVSAQVVLSVPPRTTVETEAIRQKLCTRLYRYFNPFTGGPDGKGWPLGRAARSVDVIAQLQAMEEVQYVGSVSLYSYRRNGYTEDAPWVPVSGPEATIPLGPLEVACSWQNSLQANETAPAHDLIFLEP